jgi:beta-N-acetylhexosaminidase
MAEERNAYLTSLIDRMTLDQKVGAMMTLGLSGPRLTPMVRDMILTYHCGGLRCTPTIRRFGSYIDPHSKATVVEIEDVTGFKKGVAGPRATMMEYHRLLMSLQELAMSRPGALPLHFSLDQEGGGSHNCNFPGVNLFPSPMGLAASGDPGLAYEVGLATARQLRAIGFNWVHTPVLDINVNPANPEIGTRAFSDSLEAVIEYGRAMCEGYADGGLIACGKHFPGRGDSAVDAHFGIPAIDIDKDTLLKRELEPYRRLIAEELLPTIMLAHSIYPAIDPDDVSTVSRKVITGLLREELGFDGVITTDSMTMGGIAARYGVPQACAMSLAAGADIVLMKADNDLVGRTFGEIKRYVKEGKIGAGELDAKVYRLLRMKYDYGLLHWGGYSEERPEEVVREPKIRFLSRLAARKSVLVARDRAGALPLPTDTPLLVIEQVTGRGDLEWHPGMLYEYCTGHNPHAVYLEIGYTADDADIERIRALIGNYDTVVVTNYFSRGKKDNTAMIRDEVLGKVSTTVVVSNTPYELSIPEQADTVLITFGSLPTQLQVVAGALFGTVTPEGRWPVSNHVET